MWYGQWANRSCGTENEKDIEDVGPDDVADEQFLVPLYEAHQAGGELGDRGAQSEKRYRDNMSGDAELQGLFFDYEAPGSDNYQHKTYTCQKDGFT